MFPISDSIKAARFPFLNIMLIIATIYVFVQQILAPDINAFIMQYALTPSQVNFADTASLIPFVTAIFLHGGILHILSNMWFLFVFGDNVEGELTPLGFLFLYITAGVGGNLGQYLLSPNTDVPMLGASGAVAGILGCYYVLFPHAKVKTLVFILFFITFIEVSAPFMLGYWFILQLLSGAASVPGLQSAQGGVAFFAHIVGFVIGLMIGSYYRRKNGNLKLVGYE